MMFTKTIFGGPFFRKTKKRFFSAKSPPPMDRRFEQNFQTLASVLWGGTVKIFFPYRDFWGALRAAHQTLASVLWEGSVGGIYIQWGYHSSKQFRSSKRWSNKTMLPYGVFYKKEKRKKMLMTKQRWRREKWEMKNEEMWSVRCVESNMGEMHSALVIRTKKCQTYSWSLTKTLV